MRASKLFLALLILCIAPVVLAQNACPAIIAAALESVDTACNQTTRNQLCYGNIALSATPREDVADFKFEQSGDVVGVADIETLQLSSFSLMDEEWGVALMKLQANLPETLPGQNVTFLLFGDVTMTDAGDQLVELPVTTTARDGFLDIFDGFLGCILDCLNLFFYRLGIVFKESSNLIATGPHQKGQGKG
jgi:hypothetical protein